MEKIVKDPYSILHDEKSFWEKEKAQKYTKLWAKQVNYSISYDKWREQIRRWAEIPPDEKNDHILMKNALKIINVREVLAECYTPHLFVST